MRQRASGVAFLSGGPIGGSQTDKNCTASPSSALTAIYCQLYAPVRKNPEQVTVETGRHSRPSRSKLSVTGHTESNHHVCSARLFGITPRSTSGNTARTRSPNCWRNTLRRQWKRPHVNENSAVECKWRCEQRRMT